MRWTNDTRLGRLFRGAPSQGVCLPWSGGVSWGNNWQLHWHWRPSMGWNFTWGEDAWILSAGCGLYFTLGKGDAYPDRECGLSLRVLGVGGQFDPGLKLVDPAWRRNVLLTWRRLCNWLTVERPVGERALRRARRSVPEEGVLVQVPLPEGPVLCRVTLKGRRYVPRWAPKSWAGRVHWQACIKPERPAWVYGKGTTPYNCGLDAVHASYLQVDHPRRAVSESVGAFTAAVLLGRGRENWNAGTGAEE
jgi:hypothetical protein